jgi:hypothetical protein
MDLPVSRISRSKVIVEANQDIRIYDDVFGNDLLTLTDNVRHGRYVVCVTLDDISEGHVHKLMALQSKYDFETLSRRPLLRDLSARLRDEGYVITHLGLYHHRDGRDYIGRDPVITYVDDHTQETMYVMPSAA